MKWDLIIEKKGVEEIREFLEGFHVIMNSPKRELARMKGWKVNQEYMYFYLKVVFYINLL